MSIRTEIDKAIRTNKDIEIEYVKYDGTYSKRRVSNIEYCNDYGVFGYNNDHISGYCHLRGEERHFKIERIQSIRVLPDGVIVKNPNNLTICNQFTSASNNTNTSINNRTTNRTTTQSNNSSEGCYIATMVYGYYEHPQVIILRNWRDNTLKKSWYGRTFIKIYYAFSPTFVRVFKNCKYVNNSIRNLLDKFITQI